MPEFKHLCWHVQSMAELEASTAEPAHHDPGTCLTTFPSNFLAFEFREALGAVPKAGVFVAGAKQSRNHGCRTADRWEALHDVLRCFVEGLPDVSWTLGSKLKIPRGSLLDDNVRDPGATLMKR